MQLSAILSLLRIYYKKLGVPVYVPVSGGVDGGQI
jgi:hypothetical protein